MDYNEFVRKFGKLLNKQGYVEVIAMVRIPATEYRLEEDIKDQKIIDLYADGKIIDKVSVDNVLDLQ